MKVQAEDLWPLILDFVETNFGEEDLESFKKYFSLKIDHKRDPIVKAGGLQAMLGVFLKNNKDVLKAFKAHLEAKEVEAGPKSSSKKSKKQAESSSESEEEEKPKKLAGSKRKAKEESSDDDNSSSDDDASSSDSSSEDDGKKKKFVPISKRTRAQSSDHEEYKPPAVQIKPPPTTFKFQRINEDKFREVVAKQNGEGASFESKAKFGGEGDKFGEWSYDKLKHTRGESFKKEKGKMKNRNFHSAGQRIGTGVNSIKF